MSQEWQVCQSSVGVLSDISRAIEDQLFPYCNQIMQILLENLQSNEVNRNVKPHIISAFGDIALAIGDKFEYYVQHVVSMLQSAQVMTARRHSFLSPPRSRCSIWLLIGMVASTLCARHKPGCSAQPYAYCAGDERTATAGSR